MITLNDKCYITVVKVVITGAATAIAGKLITTVWKLYLMALKMLGMREVI